MKSTIKKLMQGGGVMEKDPIQISLDDALKIKLYLESVSDINHIAERKFVDGWLAAYKIIRKAVASCGG